jgi:putative ABC transport system permease protein
VDARPATLTRMTSRVRSDIREGLRSLRRSPRYAAWIVGSLAVGMAATTAASALLNALLFQPFPGVGAQERLVRVALAGACEDATCGAALAIEQDERAALASLPGLSAVAAHRTSIVSVGVPQARTMRAARVSAGYFDVLRARPMIGNVFHPGTPDGVVLAHRTWQDVFDADPGVLSRAIRIGDRSW